MKLTAPPPSPPDSANSPGSGQPSPDEPATQVAPHPEPPSAQSPPRAVLWPAWFLGADFLMVVLALSLAFLVSSFVARNSDVWLHLAAGQRLFSGEYRPGSDPFSFSGADRVWVNHSLLFDASAYLLYGGNGAILVLLKALAVVATFGLIIALRRPPYSLWPWAATVGLAILAAAPQMQLRPIVASMLLLAVTLFLVFRLPHRPGSWRFPAAIGVTFWLWALMDTWFILGPITLALVLLGEAIQAYLRPAGSPTEGEGETPPSPFGSPPPVRTLALALGIGVAACMLNPHHVRIWELPFELVGSAEAAQDNQIRQTLLMSPLDELYRSNSVLGGNVNGLAYAVLFLAGGVVMGFGAGRRRITQLLLWIGFAALSLLNIFAIPFFAVAAAALVAAQLNAFSAGLVPKHWGDPKTRYMLLGSAAGRVGCLLLLMASCLLAWPGWMQPAPPNLAFAKRVGWGIEPDAGLVRVARQLQSWRESGKIPADAHGMVLSAELSNYCAWFAPLEKVFINADFNHHRREIGGFVDLRRELMPTADHVPNAAEVGAMLDKLGASYLVLTGTQAEVPNRRILLAQLSIYFWGDPGHWSPWYLDGRAAVTGRRASPRPASNSDPFDALRFDPTVLAFGPAVERLPALSVKPIPNPESWESEFIHGAEISPLSADDAIGWIVYQQLMHQQHDALQRWAGIGRTLGVMPGGAMQQFAWVAFASGPALPEAVQSTPFLGLRAALRAIAADPDHPDGYFALAQALRDPELPLSSSERATARATAFRQCLMRMPSPERYRPNIYRANPTELAMELFDIYSGNKRRVPGIPLDERSLAAASQLNDGLIYMMESARGEVFFVNRVQLMRDSRLAQSRVVGGPYLRAIDLCREMLELAAQYAEKEGPEEYKSFKEKLEPFKKNVEQELVKRNQDFEREKTQGGHVKLVDQVRSALKNNLVGEALKLLTDPERMTEVGRESPGELAGLALLRTSLELTVGRLEDASADLDGMVKLLDAAPNKESHQALLSRYHALVYQKLFLEGNYKAAGEVIETGAAGQIGKDPPLTAEEAAFKTGSLTALSGADHLLEFAQRLAPPPTPTMLFIPVTALFQQAIQPMRQRQETLRAVRINATNFYYQRGFLSLLEGDIAAAKTRFQQSRQPGVPAWGVAEVRHPNAEKYLSLIEAAEKKAAR